MNILYFESVFLDRIYIHEYGILHRSVVAGVNPKIWGKRLGFEIGIGVSVRYHTAVLKTYSEYYAVPCFFVCFRIP